MSHGRGLMRHPRFVDARGWDSICCPTAGPIFARTAWILVQAFMHLGLAVSNTT